jgi:hypothetical protein
MALDAKRLMRDARKAQGARPGTAIGRETTGVTRAVRESLAVIRRLRAARVTWKAIAEAMTAQGITQGGGKALTATRLTAIVGEVEARMGLPAQDLARRERRTDLAPRADEAIPVAPSTAWPVTSPSPALMGPAAGLPSSQPTDPQRPPTEAEIRRAGLAELRQILGKE